MSYVYGKFVWFEHFSNKLEAARNFYAELFGWKSEGVPIGGQTYHMIQNGSDGIGGFRTAPAGVPSHWMGYLSVPDVDASAAAAEKAGAKVLMPPTDFPSVGRGAALADPQGGAFSIWHGAQGDRADVRPIAMGDWHWNELMTSDAHAALKFYQGVFGYTDESKDMGPMGTYHILNTDGVGRAGLMKSPDATMPTRWMPYVRVADCDAAVAKAKQLGAQIHKPPTDIPNVGRFAVLADPAGAVLAIMRGDM